MASFTSNQIYYVATKRLNAAHAEALVAAKSGPMIEDLMIRNRVPVEWAVFSFLMERRIQQDELAEKAQQPRGLNKWLHSYKPT